MRPEILYIGLDPHQRLHSLTLHTVIHAIAMRFSRLHGEEHATKVSTAHVGLALGLRGAVVDMHTCPVMRCFPLYIYVYMYVLQKGPE
jgi:hypothetical protein